MSEYKLPHALAIIGGFIAVVVVAVLLLSPLLGDPEAADAHRFCGYNAPNYAWYDDCYGRYMGRDEFTAADWQGKTEAHRRFAEHESDTCGAGSGPLCASTLEAELADDDIGRPGI